MYQVIFLLECSPPLTHTHAITDATDHPTHALAPAGMDNNVVGSLCCMTCIHLSVVKYIDAMMVW